MTGTEIDFCGTVAGSHAQALWLKCYTAGKFVTLAQFGGVNIKR